MGAYINGEKLQLSGPFVINDVETTTTYSISGTGTDTNKTITAVYFDKEVYVAYNYASDNMYVADDIQGTNLTQVLTANVDNTKFSVESMKVLYATKNDTANILTDGTGGNFQHFNIEMVTSLTTTNAIAVHIYTTEDLYVLGGNFYLKYDNKYVFGVQSSSESTNYSLGGNNTYITATGTIQTVDKINENFSSVQTRTLVQPIQSGDDIKSLFQNYTDTYPQYILGFNYVTNYYNSSSGAIISNGKIAGLMYMDYFSIYAPAQLGTKITKGRWIEQ